MVIDHIGIVVRSIEVGIQRWQAMFGYRLCSNIVTNTRQRVRVAFLAKKGSITIKLVEPVDALSPVSTLAAKGGGLHHICFRCDDLRTAIPPLKEKGARLLVGPQPGEAFNNRDIAFLFAGNNLNIELIDTVEKAGWIDPSDERSNLDRQIQPEPACVE